MQKKALLLINGEPPKALASLENYAIVACTDGAYFYLPSLGISESQLDFISGDFDSYAVDRNSAFYEKHIYTPDQEQTDFFKALEILETKGVTHVEVYGGSGGEMDHFLGNLSVAYQFKERLDIRFFDQYASFYFIPPHYELELSKGQLVSLYPFPQAHGVKTSGLNWELHGQSLSIQSQIGTRNFATGSKITIEYSSGDLLLFIGGPCGKTTEV